MNKEHISTQYDADLEEIRTRMLQMGGLVEQQVRQALAAYGSGELELLEEVRRNEEKVNALEVEMDNRCNHVIARRQPTAGDLRLVMAVVKAVTDLERVGDEAAKIARIARQLHGRGMVELPGFSDVHVAAGIAVGMLKDALDAFARIDAEAAKRIILKDLQIDSEFRSILRELITFMMEDPRTISTALDVVWIAKALERVGDHAKNIAEYVVFVAEGMDVRHSYPAVENALG
ncbi:MAG: phosphate signaling complex protein PhoU [Burkholderiales bacterium]|nr:phosphate signaling complex protein PhoU [Burkholderiales bacterium]